MNITVILQSILTMKNYESQDRLYHLWERKITLFKRKSSNRQVDRSSRLVGIVRILLRTIFRVFAASGRWENSNRTGSTASKLMTGQLFPFFFFVFGYSSLFSIHPAALVAVVVIIMVVHVGSPYNPWRREQTELCH